MFVVRAARCKEVTLEECQAYKQLKNDVTEAKLLYNTKQELDAVCGYISLFSYHIVSSLQWRFPHINPHRKIIGRAISPGPALKTLESATDHVTFVYCQLKM